MSHDIVIAPGVRYRHYWRDLWDYRELFAFLAWRDISVRYRQTVIGIAWSVLQPVLTMLVFTVVFGRIANLPSGGAPYPLLVFAALLPWQFFANALNQSSQSLVGNANLITKIFFPRAILPASAVIVTLVDFAIAFVVLLVLMVAFQFWPSVQILAVLPLTLVAGAAALGAGLWFSALNVRYRDFRYLVPFVVQFGLFISPVGFSSNLVPADLRVPYSLNPMVGIIDGFRWAILGQSDAFLLPSLALSLAVSAVLLISGVRYFRSTERHFADVI